MSYDAIAAAVTAAAEQRQPACGASRVIAIDGPSGSGKTDLAACWQGMSDTAVLHLEDLYPGWLGLEATPPVVAEMLAKVATGQDAAAVGWDWAQERPGGAVHLAPRPLIVVEGVGAAASVIRPFLSLIVWVDAPSDVRHERAMARDGDTFAPWWQTWADQERRHFARELARTHADIVVAT